MPGLARWEGPGRAIVIGSLAFPAHASLWFRGTEWGGTLYIDSYAPLYEFDELRVELELRGVGVHSVRVEQITQALGVESPWATVVRFVGVEPLAPPGDGLGEG